LAVARRTVYRNNFVGLFAFGFEKKLTPKKKVVVNELYSTHSIVEFEQVVEKNLLEFYNS